MTFPFFFAKTLQPPRAHTKRFQVQTIFKKWLVQVYGYRSLLVCAVYVRSEIVERWIIKQYHENVWWNKCHISHDL